MSKTDQVKSGQFEPLEAAVNPAYLFENTDAARAFADGALDLEHVEFIQALKIKGVLKEKVDPDILRSALKRGGAPGKEALFYLSKVGVPELEGEIMELLSAELERDGEADTSVYWMIRALAMMATSSADFYLKGLKAHPKAQQDPLIKLVLVSPS